jgi:DNA repair protein RadC
MGLSQPVDRAYGLGMAKTAQLKAALEIGRRLGLSQLDEKYQFYFACPLTVFNVLVSLAFWLYCPLTTIKVC